MKAEKEKLVSVKEVVKDERTHKIAGFSSLLLGLFIFLSIVSYCFTWKEDQDKVLKAGSDFLFADNLPVANLLGRLGAWTGHTLVYNGFGIASLLLCTFFLILGVNLIFGKKIFSIAKNLKYVLTGLVFFSVALAFLTSGAGFSWGGAVGEMISTYFTKLIGKTGTAALLLVAGGAWFIWRFNPAFNLPEKKAKPVAEREAEPADLPAVTPIAPAKKNGKEAVPANGRSVNELYAEKGGAALFIDEDDRSPLETQSAGAGENSMSGDGNVTVILPQKEAEKVNPLHEFGVVVGQEEEPVAENVAVIAPETVLPAEEGPHDPETITVIQPKNKKVAPELELVVQAPVEDDEPDFAEAFTAGELDEEEEEDVIVPVKQPVEMINVVNDQDNAGQFAGGEELQHQDIENLPPYDPFLDLKDYKFPGLDLLEPHGSEKIITNSQELEDNKNQIIATLKNYAIEIQRISATVGPTVTLYEIVPAPGVRISRIKNLEDDIALSLAALGIRIIAPIPGKGTIGIEVPNVRKTVVSMKTLLSGDKFQKNDYSLPIAIGKRIDNEHFVVDLATMPHMLMAGATGQGKSVGLNAVLVSLLYKKHPSQLKLVLVDPKKVELSLYRLIEKHFLAKLPGEEEPIITDTKKVVHTLNALCIEMDNRYDLLKEAGVRNIREYNEKFVKRRLNPQKGHQYLPFIVLVIDEFADLIMTAGKEVEMPIARLAQLARAVGIHLIIATQRPSVNIITGTIKANFPSRIAFKVSSKIDSRTILDAGGAEQLIGKGDLLVSHNGELTRLQCAFVDTPEVERVAEYIGRQRGYPDAFLLPEYEGENEKEAKDFDLSDKDPLFNDAARLIVQNQMGSTSLIQRRMKLGYNRAGRLMDQLEQAGIVGPNLGSKAREVLVHSEMELEEMLGNF